MYNLEVFTDQFEYVDFDFIDERQPLDMDYLAYNAYTVTTKMMDAKKGYFVRITRDNAHVASGYIADVQPGKTTQEISIKPLQSLFDVEVFYTPVSDCITWLATNIQAALMNNADTLQNRPITLTYTASADALPLTGFNLHKTVNILSVIISALKTYGVVCTMSLDVTNKRIVVDIAQQTATQTIEANLENVLQSSVTLGDSYGSTNKLIIRKTDKDSGENLGETIFYLHNDGTINTTDTNRIYPVFWELETLDTEDDQTAAQWLEKATARAKEVLEPAKYDNEIVLMYDVDDQIVHPADAQIGTDTTIYLDGLTYASILTGKKIEGQKITLTYGVVRQDLTKKLAIRQRETMTFENTASAIIQEAREVFPSKSAVANTYAHKHPVGSIVITSTNTNPSGTYGGTWELVRRLWGGELIAVGIAKASAEAPSAMTSGTVYAFSQNYSGATKEYTTWNFLGGIFNGEAGTLKCYPNGIVGTIIVDVYLSGSCESGTNSESGIWWRNSNSNPLPAGVNMMSSDSREPLSMLGKAGDYGSAYNQYIYSLAQGVTGDFFINPQFLCYRNPTWLTRGGTGCKLIAKAYARNESQYMWKRTA